MYKLFLILLLIPNLAYSESAVSDCTFRGKKLFGRIQFVSSMPDIRVRSVSSASDLRVQTVTHVPSQCGEWQIVKSFPDIRVQIDANATDFTIQFVDSFPGVGP